MIQTSELLRYVERSDGVAVYHSLHGGLCLVDRKVSQMFKVFEKPRDPNTETIGDYSRKAITDFVRLFKARRFLVEPGYDEYEPIRAKMAHRQANLDKGQLLGVVQLVLTNICNFRCKYCFEYEESIYSSEERFRLETAPNNRFMSPKTARTALDEAIRVVKQSGRKQLHIQFFGGEPLVCWSVIKSVFDHFGSGQNHGIALSYSVVTNGSLVTREVADYFKRYRAPIIISTDSPRGTERVDAGGNNTHEQVTKAFALLRDNGNLVVMNAVLSESTFELFDPDLVDYAHTWGVREIGVVLDLNPDFYQRRGDEAIVNRLWRMIEYANSKGIVVTGYWHQIFLQIASFEIMETRGYKTCSATGCQLSVEPSGDIFSCKGSSGHYGHISALDDLLRSPQYASYAMREFHNSPICKGCEIENFCSGLCLGPLEKKYGDIHVVEESACDTYRGITRKLIANLEQSRMPYFSYAREAATAGI